MILLSQISIADDAKPNNCPSSPILSLVLCEMCFTRNFTRALVNNREGSWHVFISKKKLQLIYFPLISLPKGGSVVDFCAIDDPDGVAGLLQDPNTNPLFPISHVFPDIDLYFERVNNDQDYNWDGPVRRKNGQG